MATSSNLGPTQGSILLGKNYEFWSLRMRSSYKHKSDGIHGSWICGTRSNRPFRHDKPTENCSGNSEE
jgi:hypothetical protein